eukprot:887435-Pyramimonas_sp.AAC.1
MQDAESAEDLRLAHARLSTHSFGALSHCSLTRGLMSRKHGAAWDIPEEHNGHGLGDFQTGPGGSWDVPRARRAGMFSDLIDMLDHGLLGEALF